MTGPLPLTPAEIDALLASVHLMTAEEQEAVLADLDRLEHNALLQRCRSDFLAFCNYVYDGFKEGPHHRHLLPLLHNVNAGTEIRLTVSMPPRFGKSETIAYLFVAWYLGHNPTHHIMMATHTADLSASFGRKVRNLIDSPKYNELFPDTVVSRDKSAADNWTTTKGGKYLAIGIGGNVAGHGAHLLIADDLVSEQAVLANPDAAFETAWTYMQVGPLQRLMPGGRIIMIGCLTAETRVLLADGTEKEIKDIRAGDRIATYEDGGITESKVTNWIEHRPDQVYKIKTTSGKVVRANERHPFLVDRSGSREWVRTRDLKVGDCMVQVTGASGAASSAQLRAAESRPSAKVCATLATASNTGLLASAAQRLSKSAKGICAIATASLARITTACWPSKVVSAQSASARQPQKTPAPEANPSSTSTTATAARASADCCATTATSPSGMPAPNARCSGPLSTYAVTPDPIVEIVPDGVVPVYDIEVARTENFIANGLVSHNTRWGKKDPIGRALQWAIDNPDSVQWNEVRFPALMKVQREGEEKEISLWPEQWPVEQLQAKRAGMQPQFWAAQYMQEPTSEEGALLKRDWWRVWDKTRPPPCDYVLITVDTAHETKNMSDFSVFGTWGVFYNEQTERNEIILLNVSRGRWEFPELKTRAFEHMKDWEPDTMLIEKKAAGAPLIQELRQAGLFIEESSPSRGKVGVSNDKRARVNAVSSILQDGCCWIPDKRWAWELVEECASFPNSDHDDMVDVTEMALSRFRRGGFLSLASDKVDDDPEWLPPPRREAYY